MNLVVADTGPINYLILIGHIDVLPALFSKVIMPFAVRDELNHPDWPGSVRQWIASPPSWLDIRGVKTPNPIVGLGAGESAAISLAIEIKADLLLRDDRRGVKAARREALRVTGTLGILSRAGQLGILDLAQAFTQLKQTSFRYRQEVLDQFLDVAARKQ